MAFINKKDFSILYDMDLISEKVKEQYFECDEMIAPTISLLNKKGYKTKYCCSGHSYPYSFTKYHESLPVELENKNGIILDTVELCDEMKDFYEKCGRNCSYKSEVFYPTIKKIRLYILFEKTYNFSNLPKGFFIDERRIDRTCIRGHFENLNVEGFSRITIVYEINKSLYEWAESLPYLEK